MASKTADKFTKKQIKEANTLNFSIDLLEILLEDGKEYSIDEVQKKIDAFNKREVKY